ncbi:membrane protein [Defluviimonas sp. 20V17]|uniref:Membrane protein n=2 Tax=Allgaiera indica TaxID=765699 RepID=A0AAN4UPF1_9RHOB|nr:membrane protein [Defluviimonas sp. 20V17]GHD99856.1 membrane protein [Allgaiera indica]
MEQDNMTATTRPDRIPNRVPQVTWDFWVIKLLAVTVGETAADFLSQTLGLGLPLTSLLMSAVLVLSLIWQFRQKAYVPMVYWTAVVLISIVGTLISDNLVDNLGFPLSFTTPVFAAALAATFIAWYAVERTLSIHAIFTFRREAFYWLAILFTFALGTSAGDQLSEGLGLGYLTAGAVYGAVIAVIAGAFYAGWMNGVLAFWLAYILTRPMGASFGDYLSQPLADGGLGLGTVGTSALFLTAIAATVVYMSLSHDGEEAAQSSPRG